jgi:hypothetical protein
MVWRGGFHGRTFQIFQINYILTIQLKSNRINDFSSFFILLEKTRIMGRGKVSESQTKLFKLISVNCILFSLHCS